MFFNAASRVTQTHCHLLNLPYDIRALIYEHIFPPGEQIYIQAHGTSLRAILPHDGIATEIVGVCPQIHDEASGFLYNNYLFNIVGTKRDCLEAYGGFLKTMQKYARDEVRVDAFSNGDHSSTMCISLQVGNAKMAVLDRRRRGEPKTMKELQEEYKIKIRTSGRVENDVAKCLLGGLLAALLAWLLVAWIPYWSTY